METVTLSIDGKTISARAGSTVLEVARQHGISIPTLCHHNALRSIGACRVCQVEEESRGLVVPACVTKVQAGMVIATNSERVVRNRRNIVRLLLAAHPESCVVCEKGNRCELRDLAAQLGVGRHGLDPMPYHPRVEDLNPFMTRDLSKCIMCAKCVRADQELVCEGVIDYNDRGFDAHPATLFSRPLETARCTFCGTCLTVCPTGAIAEKNKTSLDHAGGRTRSVCSFCACGCSINLEQSRGQVAGVSPAGTANTPNGISMCVKGHFGHDYLNSRERLSTPLLKTGEGFKPVSWEEALDLAGRELGRIRDEHGGAALGFIGGARGTNEEDYLFQKLARAVFQTNNVDFSARSNWDQVFRTLLASTGFAAGSSSFKDIEAADAILVVGADPAATAPVLGYHIRRAARRKETSLIVIDPVRNKLVPLAEVWLRPRVGADYHLLRGLLRVILEENLTDQEFVTTKTRDLAGLTAAMAKVSVAECAALAGVEEDELRRAARLFAAAPAGFVVFGHGVSRQADAGDLAALLVDLVLLTGNLGKNRAGLMPVIKDSNAQGALDMGLAPDLLPGQRLFSDNPALLNLKSVWGAAVPAEAGLDAPGMIAAAAEGRLKGAYVFGDNPAACLPGAEALGKLDFLVVQDLFMTETAALADLVLPSAAWAEKTGTVTNMERRVQRLNRAAVSPGDFPPDWRVMTELAARLGSSWKYASTDDVLREIETVVPLYAEMSRARLDERAVFWPLPGLEDVFDTLPHGIGHPDGKALLLAPNGGGAAPAPGGEYPYLLMQGGVLAHLGTGARSSHSKRLKMALAGPYVAVSPEDMAGNGLAEGDMVRVVSAKAEVSAPVRGDSALPPGLVFMPACFAEARPSVLFPEPADGQANGGSKHCPVRLEKV